MHTQDFPQLASIEAIEQGFESFGYICSPKIATAVFLAFQLRKPIHQLFTNETLHAIKE